MSDLTPEQIKQVKSAVSLMQMAYDALQDVDDRQKTVSSESFELLTLTMKLLHHYQLFIPEQVNHKAE